jgi:hypothetical protein
MTGRPRVAGLLVSLAALPLAACAEVESAAVDGYQPSHIEEVEGSDVQRVTFTKEGARRTALETALVRTRGAHQVVPYAALIYDGEGATWVYREEKELTFMRAPVEVDRIANGGRVLLTEGPPAGSRVVTVGAAEVYGAELGMDGGH